MWKLRRSAERLEGVSIPTQVTVLLNAALWGAYSVLTDAFWVGAAGLVNAPLAVLTIVVVRRSRAGGPHVDLGPLPRPADLAPDALRRAEPLDEHGVVRDQHGVVRDQHRAVRADDSDVVGRLAQVGPRVQGEPGQVDDDARRPPP
ncbi:hypothetical protein [Cellulomonas fimi]|uniref:Uncharacterized protein n=1 Tax=Cellulomonas fimi TaxID=1708 RepID=A0A7Y0M0N4_CELFI|nr:hypothetical protein [Cellulomonas fimi]NMR21384.1 hypothetical protein [Cellulomonas fimi]